MRQTGWFFVFALLCGIASDATEAASASPPLWGADDGFKPFDILVSIRQHFHDHLPTTWFINEPEKTEKGYRVRLTIAGEWGGNPVSAARNSCPDRKSIIWQHIEQILITPFYLKRAWPTVECR